MDTEIIKKGEYIKQKVNIQNDMEENKNSKEKVGNQVKRNSQRARQKNNMISKNANENEKEIEIKLNKEKQKWIRLVAIKDNKTFSKSKKENYKIGAVISNQK